MTRNLAANALAQVLGRLATSGLRLASAAMIVRLAGASRFGEYVLVISIVLLFEWLVDGGQTDLVVRDASRHGADAAAELGALVWLKALQGLLLAPLLPAALFLLGYSIEMVAAAAVAGVGLVAYAAALVLRTLFKLTLTLGRDAAAEALAALAVLPLLWLACVRGLGLPWLVGCYALSRVLFLALAVTLRPAFAAPRLRGRDVRAAARRLAFGAIPLGLSGLIVWTYDALAPVMLSKLSDLHQVALFAAPARYVFAAIGVIQAFNAAVFPALARAWGRSPTTFVALQQTALEASVFAAAAFACTAVAGASFLMAIIGPDVAAAAPVLQLMCAILALRAISTAMTPLIVLADRQSVSLRLTLVSVALQIALIWLLAPRLGAIGAAAACLIVEIITIAPTIVIAQRAVDTRLAWAPVLLIAGSAVLALALARWTPVFGGWAGGALCLAAFLVIALLVGAISPPRLRRMARDLAAGPLAKAEP